MQTQRVAVMMRWLVALGMVSLLLPCVVMGADTDALCTQLEKAVYRGDVRGIKTLVGKGAGFDPTRPVCWWPLKWAAAAGRADTVRAVLDGGIDVNVKGLRGETLLMNAASTMCCDAGVLVTTHEGRKTAADFKLARTRAVKMLL